MLLGITVSAVVVAGVLVLAVLGYVINRANHS
jgi:hypothetical protein